MLRPRISVIRIFRMVTNSPPMCSLNAIDNKLLNASTITDRQQYFCSQSVPFFTEVPAVFNRIKKVSSPGICEKINAVYVFDVEGEGKWHVDMTSGDGHVGQGPPPHKPDVTVSVSKENFLKMFNRELKPATAFMTGQLKLSGDLSKALALEKVMKASRDEY